MEDLFSGGFSYIIIAFVVFSIIMSVVRSQAAKKKKEQERREAQQSGQAPPTQRQTAMSDIQKAFMMMSGLDSAEQPTAPAPAPAPRGEGSFGSEGLAGSEGRTGIFPGEHSMAHEGMDRHEGQPGSEGRSGSEGQAGSEGLAGSEGTGARTPAAFSRMVASSGPVISPNIEIGTYFMDEEEEEVDPDVAVIPQKRSAADVLHLFEGKDEYTKAVLYSEILKRRSTR